MYYKLLHLHKPVYKLLIQVRKKFIMIYSLLLFVLNQDSRLLVLKKQELLENVEEQINEKGPKIFNKI